MAKQISLREFQQGLAQRLREAQAEAEPTSRLGVQAGGGNWLLKLDDAGEMLALQAEIMARLRTADCGLRAET